MEKKIDLVCGLFPWRYTVEVHNYATNWLGILNYSRHLLSGPIQLLEVINNCLFKRLASTKISVSSLYNISMRLFTPLVVEIPNGS